MRPFMLIPLLWTVLITGCTGKLLPQNRAPELMRTGQFIMVTTTSGDTLASLARTYLEDKDRAWQIAAFNQIETVIPGQRIIIPLVPLTYGGLHQNGYQTVPVLLYNELADTPARPGIVSARRFERHLDFLRTNGFPTISLDLFHEFLQLKNELPPQAVVITFDTTAAWAYGIAFPALKQRGMKAAFFITPDDVGQKGKLTWPQLAEMAAAGFDIGLYGSKIKLPAKEEVKAYLESFEADLAGPQKTFDRYLKRPCRFYVYPGGESNDLTIAMLKKHGYSAAFTRKRGGNPFFVDNYKIKRSVVFGHYDMATFRQNLTTFRSADLK